MHGITRSKTWILCGMMAALLMAVPHVEAGSDDDNGKNKSKKSKVRVEVKYDFETGLVQCADVDVPAALLTCGGDQLIGGKVEIKKDGSVEVHVAGALPSASYDVVYVSFDGTTLPIGTIQTDLSGNAKQKWLGFFALGDTGSGNLVLQRSNLDQFISGFAVIK